MPKDGRAGRRTDGRFWRWSLAACVCLAPGSLSAQVDTARADTTRAPADTIDAYQMLVAGQEDAQTLARKFPRSGLERLLPPFGRIVLPRDSIDFINGETLGDVLATIPGIYLWRGGWIGSPEVPNYFGRGATSVEYIVDGIPWVAMGPDSLALDPSFLPIGLIDRIELEPLPGLLRVHLMLRNHDVLAPRTRLVVARGTQDQARYEGLIEKRFRSGFGFGLGAEYSVRDAPNQASGDFSNSIGWIQTDWVPSRNFGVQLRYLLHAPDRTRTLTRTEPADTLIRPVNGTRGDFTARVFLGGSNEGRLGPRADLSFTNTTWASDSLNQDRWQAGLVLSNRSRTTSLEASAFLGSRWTRMDTRVIAGWSPSGLVSTSVEGAYQRYQSERDGRWLAVRAGLALPLRFTVAGTWRLGDFVDHPSVLTDRDQRISDRQLSLTFEPFRAFSAHASYTRLAAFRPTGMWAFAQIDSIAPNEPTQWMVLGGRLSPRQWLTVSGWYHHPIDSLVEGTPPNHSLVELAIRSKFLRTFPSGIFDIKLAATVENWGTGVIGRDFEGNPVTLKGSTIFRALAQMQLAGVIVYFDRSNLLNTDLPFVPGLPIPSNVYSFGIRWGFLN